MNRRMVVIRNQDIAIVGVGEWLPDGTWRFLDEQDAVISTTCDRPHLSAAICWAQAVVAQHPSAQPLPPVAGSGTVEPAGGDVAPAARLAPVAVSFVGAGICAAGWYGLYHLARVVGAWLG